MGRWRGSVRGLSALLLLGTGLTGCQDGAEPTGPLPGGPAVSAAYPSGVGSGAVNGGGRATATDIFGGEYDAQFAFSATADPDGTAHGWVSLAFGPEFSAVWGVVPDVQAIHVWGGVTAIVAGDGGEVVLSGTVTEVETVRGGEKVVFDNEPFELVVTGPESFNFTWCEVPTFELEVTSGRLVYHAGGSSATALSSGGADVLQATASGGGCPRAGGV